MGYRKIASLQIDHPILLFREVFAAEKIHGTSSHINLTKSEKGWDYKISAGGIKHNDFVFMLNMRYQFSTTVIQKVAEFAEPREIKKIAIYGEGYGGKVQGMDDVYGPLNFIVFEVVKDGRWCGIEEASRFAAAIGLPFVYFEKGPTTVEWLDAQRDRPSEQAKRNGMGDDKISEGIVLRPPIELYDDAGGRLLAKYRKEKFQETRTARKLSLEDVQTLADAKEIAEEWVVEERLNHVLSALVAKGHPTLTMKDTGLVIQEMISDVSTEASGQIVWSEAAGKAIGKKTAELFKRRIIQGGIVNPIEGT